MKKLAIYGFALIIALLAACSDDSSSSSKEDYVSCQMNKSAENEAIPMYCIQMPKSFKDSLNNLCDLTSSYKDLTFSMRDTKCDDFMVKKECVDPKNSAVSYLVYNSVTSWKNCEEIIFNDKIIKEIKELYNSLIAETENVEEKISFAAAYNIPEKRCLQYNAEATPLSDLKAAIGKRHPKLDSLGKGLIGLTSCDKVAEIPVAICSDNDTFNAVTVFFYDPALKGKKCKDLITFVPREVPKDEEEKSKADTDKKTEEK